MKNNLLVHQGIDRPYERCRKNGPKALSDSELLSIIIRTGTKGINAEELSKRILSENNAGLNGIYNMSFDELLQIKGIGCVKALQIMCIVELSKRIAKAGFGMKPIFSNPDTVAGYYMEDMRHKECEEVLVLLLNTKSLLIKELWLCKGTVNSSVISPREILIDALKNKAVYFIVIHNHPSGDPNPSADDISCTKRIKEAGELVGINLLDHIIIGDNKYISMKRLKLF